jgi:hypothetical protein
MKIFFKYLNSQIIKINENENENENKNKNEKMAI